MGLLLVEEKYVQVRCDAVPGTSVKWPGVTLIDPPVPAVKNTAESVGKFVFVRVPSAQVSFKTVAARIASLLDTVNKNAAATISQPERRHRQNLANILGFS